MTPLRVIQWATGTVGRHAVRAVHDRSDMELVGARVYSEAKAGRDLGELCGMEPIGVLATDDPAAIVALDADCVLYMAQGEGDPNAAVTDICQLLTSGKNVVSTAVTSLIYPAAAGSEVLDRLETACAAGDSTFHATGIEPGWAAEVLPLAMSCLFRRIDSLVVQEILDYSTYPSAEMLFGFMGFGRPPEELPSEEVMAAAGSAFHAPLMLLAEGMGARIERFTYERDVRLAEKPFEIRAGGIEAGTVAAIRYAYRAVINDRPALTVEHVTRLREDQAPDWPNGRGWRVTVEGEPSMVLDARIAVRGEDENDQACLGTAMHAVHAVPAVCAAAAGVRTFLDLPTIVGTGVL